MLFGVRRTAAEAQNMHVPCWFRVFFLVVLENRQCSCVESDFFPYMLWVFPFKNWDLQKAIGKSSTTLRGCLFCLFWK